VLIGRDEALLVVGQAVDPGAAQASERDDTFDLDGFAVGDDEPARSRAQRHRVRQYLDVALGQHAPQV
jgi:hypothetical protein